ncbi:hypothetical protein Tco_0730188 [Tanacetum coccineum]|uniref:Uncharacterized protein n=1 Tax=Tanacetum coccineum TaxID=301880 RepID=A0ABQ4YTV6_9ASTR
MEVEVIDVQIWVVDVRNEVVAVAQIREVVVAYVLLLEMDFDGERDLPLGDGDGVLLFWCSSLEDLRLT